MHWTEETDHRRTTMVGIYSRDIRNNFHPWASSDGDQTNDPFWVLPKALDLIGDLPYKVVSCTINQKTHNLSG